MIIRLFDCEPSQMHHGSHHLRFLLQVLASLLRFLLSSDVAPAVCCVGPAGGEGTREGKMPHKGSCCCFLCAAQGPGPCCFDGTECSEKEEAREALFTPRLLPWPGESADRLFQASKRGPRICDKCVPASLAPPLPSVFVLFGSSRRGRRPKTSQRLETCKW